MIEIWKEILDGVYEVSNLGRVKRVSSGRILKPYLEERGYLTVRPSVNNITKKYTVHYLVADTFLGTCPDGLQVNHKDGIKTNNRANNLEYVTGRQNMKHAYDNGLITKLSGEKGSAHKLTAVQVEKIRDLYSRGSISQEKLGEMFGVGQTAIENIVNRRTWK